MTERVSKAELRHKEIMEKLNEQTKILRRIESKLNETDKKEIDEDNKNLIQVVTETKKSTKLTIAILGFTMFGLTIPSIIKLTGMEWWGESTFILVYTIGGVYLMIDSFSKIDKLNKELKKINLSTISTKQ